MPTVALYTLPLAHCDTRPVFVLFFVCPPSVVSGRRADRADYCERVAAAGVGVYRACLAAARLPHGRRGQQPPLQSAPSGPAAKVCTTTTPLH